MSPDSAEHQLARKSPTTIVNLGCIHLDFKLTSLASFIAVPNSIHSVGPFKFHFDIRYEGLVGKVL